MEFEGDPATGHVAWRVAGRRAGVARARAVAGDGAVDRILRDAVTQVRAQAREAPTAEERESLRGFAGRLWRERHGPTGADDQSRLF